ncbi:MAG: 3'-5' exonuclease [Eubacteriales bacterium]|nr:3'-5' exonuclease [Eubacteriales bacterium]
MKYVFIDLEMNSIPRKCKKERSICKREIIEIGAIVLDDNYQEIGCFKEFVKPDYSDTIFRKYTELTGITTGMVAGANRFEKVLCHFAKWCEELDDSYIIYAWSDSDLYQIQKEMQLKQIETTALMQNLFDNWQDFQREYCDMIDSKNVISLERALNNAGIGFEGKIHDALWDARNTSKLFVMSRDPMEMQAIRDLIHFVQEEEKPEEVLSLGSLFDFSALQIA